MHGLVWCIMKCMQHLAYVANRNSRAESFAVSYCWAAALFSRLMFLVRKCKLLSKLTSFPTVTRKKRGLLQNGTELLYNRMCAKYVTIWICSQWLLAYIIIVQIAAVSYISFVFCAGQEIESDRTIQKLNYAIASTTENVIWVGRKFSKLLQRVISRTYTRPELHYCSNNDGSAVWTFLLIALLEAILILTRRLWYTSSGLNTK